jgi:hypothetical protein
MLISERKKSFRFIALDLEFWSVSQPFFRLNHTHHKVQKTFFAKFLVALSAKLETHLSHPFPILAKKLKLEYFLL